MGCALEMDLQFPMNPNATGANVLEVITDNYSGSKLGMLYYLNNLRAIDAFSGLGQEAHDNLH